MAITEPKVTASTALRHADGTVRSGRRSSVREDLGPLPAGRCEGPAFCRARHDLRPCARPAVMAHPGDMTSEGRGSMEYRVSLCETAPQAVVRVPLEIRPDLLTDGIVNGMQRLTEVTERAGLTASGAPTITFHHELTAGDTITVDFGLPIEPAPALVQHGCPARHPTARAGGQNLPSRRIRRHRRRLSRTAAMAFRCRMPPGRPTHRGIPHRSGRGERSAPTDHRDQNSGRALAHHRGTSGRIICRCGRADTYRAATERFSNHLRNRYAGDAA